MLKFLELLELALKNLNRYKLRSFLTTLGIVFGIGAVVSMMSVGAGARGEILAQIRKMGVKNIIINTVKPPEEKTASKGSQKSSTNKYGLTFRDAEYLKTILKSADKVLKVHQVRKKVYYKNRILEAKILGVESEYFDAMNIQVGKGRLLHYPDYPQHRRVCVIGPGITKEFLYFGDPLKFGFRIGDQFFNVVGVSAEEKISSKIDAALMGGESLNIYIPFSTSVKRFGTFSVVRKTGSWDISKVELQQIIVSCKKVEQVLDTTSIIASVFKNFHKKRDYEIIVPLKQLQQAEQTQKVFRIVMVLIAGISLLVGGIGIANIMFATVTERTREIGIRRALGARKNDIMIQFLCETLVIAIIGGILGCGFGILGIYGIKNFTGWQTSVNIQSIAFTLIVSCLVGIFSGIAPAHYAARMNPVASLRHE